MPPPCLDALIALLHDAIAIAAASLITTPFSLLIALRRYAGYA